MLNVNRHLEPEQHFELDLQLNLYSQQYSQLDLQVPQLPLKRLKLLKQDLRWLPLLLLFLPLLLLRLGAGLQGGQLLGRPQLQVGPPGLELVWLGLRVLPQPGWLGLGLGLPLLPLLFVPLLLLLQPL